MAHPKHAEVRARFQGRCGYCQVSEADAGGELTIDHYLPVIAGGTDADENLVYCCFRCNLFKGDFHPSEADRLAGRIVLHPLIDRTSRHVQLDEKTGQLEPLTARGRFHIVLLHLNRPALVAYRLQQRYGKLIAARVELIEAENRELRAIIQAQEKYIKRLASLVDDPQ